MYENLELMIGGKWRQGGDGKAEEVLNPATEKVLGKLPHASKADLDEALDAATNAFTEWRRSNPYTRATLLKRVGELIRDNADRIATIMTLEQGKPLPESKIEVSITAESHEWAAEECKRTYGRIVPSRYDGTRMLVDYEPIGPVAAFSPWNFPALMPMRKVATAVAAGCSVIVKPAEETPGTAIAIARLYEQAGAPPGLVNVVFGVPSDVSTHLIASPDIRKISFTGSIPVGKHLMKLAAEGMKKVTMELGGHSPVVIFDDVDVEKVAKMTASSKYRNAGQVCISPTRFYVHESIHKDFTGAFTDVFKSVKVGDGLDDAVNMGPMANPRRVDAMEDFVADARSHGAKVECGGSRIGNQGFFFEPTVLTDVPDDARIMQVEPFGPVTPIVPFRDYDEVVTRANSLPYGLAAYAFTGSTGRAQELSQDLEAGMVALNSLNIASPETPFGGVKESGIGREAGIEGILEHMSMKTISLTAA
ncbi:MAG: NAD-dependent succinate-semialdehyde dehydrogenase [Gammaproteobacteria bacterium]